MVTEQKDSQKGGQNIDSGIPPRESVICLNSVHMSDPSVSFVDSESGLVRASIYSSGSRFGGKVRNYKEDGFLVIFSDAQRAVECALDIQRKQAKVADIFPADQIVRHRVGVHIGDIPDGEVILAAEDVAVSEGLRDMAHPGNICMSGRVYNEIKDKVDFDMDIGAPRALEREDGALAVYDVIFVDPHAVVEEEPVVATWGEWVRAPWVKVAAIAVPLVLVLAVVLLNWGGGTEEEADKVSPADRPPVADVPVGRMADAESTPVIPVPEAPVVPVPEAPEDMGSFTVSVDAVEPGPSSQPVEIAVSFEPPPPVALPAPAETVPAVEARPPVAPPEPVEIVVSVEPPVPADIPDPVESSYPMESPGMVDPVEFAGSSTSAPEEDVVIRLPGGISETGPSEPVVLAKAPGEEISVSVPIPQPLPVEPTVEVARPIVRPDFGSKGNASAFRRAQMGSRNISLLSLWVNVTLLRYAEDSPLEVLLSSSGREFDVDVWGTRNQMLSLKIAEDRQEMSFSEMAPDNFCALAYAMLKDNVDEGIRVSSRVRDGVIEFSRAFDVPGFEAQLDELY